MYNNKINSDCKVLIVGGTGYLGKHVIRKLSKEGYFIICTYLEGEIVEDIRTISDDILFIPCDLEKIEQLLYQNNFEWVINFAALYEKNNVRISSIINVNTILGLQLLAIACENNVKNFLTIDTSLPDNFNLYSFTKKRFADFGKFLSEKEQINFINIKLEMFYGEDEPDNRFIGMCIKKLKLNQPISLTNGTQVRDIIHVLDVVNIIYLIMQKSLSGYNEIPVGTGIGAPIKEIVEYMKISINSKSLLQFGKIEKRKNEPDCVADIKILFEIIGHYKFQYNWKSGLLQVINGEKI